MSTKTNFVGHVVLTQAQYNDRKSKGTLVPGTIYDISDYTPGGGGVEYPLKMSDINYYGLQDTTLALANSFKWNTNRTDCAQITINTDSLTTSAKNKPMYWDSDNKVFADANAYPTTLHTPYPLHIGNDATEIEFDGACMYLKANSDYFTWTKSGEDTITLGVSGKIITKGNIESNAITKIDERVGSVTLDDTLSINVDTGCLSVNLENLISEGNIITTGNIGNNAVTKLGGRIGEIVLSNLKIETTGTTTKVQTLKPDLGTLYIGNPDAEFIDYNGIGNKYMYAGTGLLWQQTEGQTDTITLKVDTDAIATQDWVEDQNYSSVSVSSQGTSETLVNYITVNGNQYKLAGGSGGTTKYLHNIYLKDSEEGEGYEGEVYFSFLNTCSGTYEDICGLITALPVGVRLVATGITNNLDHFQIYSVVRPNASAEELYAYYAEPNTMDHIDVGGWNIVSQYVM